MSGFRACFLFRNNSILAEFLDSLTNAYTDMVNTMIPDIILFLVQRNYGQITKIELNDKDDDLKSLVNDPTTPVDTTFTKVKTFKALCNLVTNTKAEYQHVSMQKPWLPIL